MWCDKLMVNLNPWIQWHSYVYGHGLTISPFNFVMQYIVLYDFSHTNNMMMIW